MTSTCSAADTGLPKPRRIAPQKHISLSLPILAGAGPRATLEAQIEWLIDMLDRVTLDPDLEPDADLEPSLGCHDGRFAVDAEHDHSDDESWLGSLDRALDQTRWSEGHAFNACNDLELDRSDSEPSLGSVSGQGNQQHWAQGKNAELNGDERDDDNDSGCADPGGMEEQTGLPHAGRGILMLEEDVEAARETTRRLGAILARISSADGSAVRS